nr:hypothetical protein [Tanacetum cinerariifolium]
MVLGYKLGLKSVKERPNFFKINESVYIEDIKLLKVEIQMKDIAIKELRRKLKVALKEKAGIQLIVEKLENASKSLNKLIDSQIMDNCKKGLGYNAVPPSYIRLFIPPKHDLSYISLEEFTSEPAVETLNAKTSEDVPKNEQLLKDIKKLELMVLWYKLGLKSVKERLKFFKTNESVYIEDIKLLKVEIQMKDIAIKELRRKLKVALKEKAGIQLIVKKLENASKSLNKLIDSQIMDNCKKGLGYNAVPPSHIRLFIPPKHDLSYIILEEITSEPAVETLNAKTSEDVPKKPMKTKKMDTQVPQLSVPTESVVNEAVNEEMDDNLERDTTTATSLDTECKEAIGDTSAHTRYERVSKISNDQLLIEDKLKRTKTAQQTTINGLKRRVKKLEKKHMSRTHKLKRLYKYSLTAKVISSSEKEDLGEENAFKQERINNDIDADEDITLVNDQEMFDADKDLQGEEVVVEQDVVADKERSVDAAHVSATATTITIDDITLAKALEDLKTSRNCYKGS